MAVTVKYFASMRERMGRQEESIAHNAGLTIADVWAQVSGETSLEGDVVTALNLEYVDATTEVADGDEVAFFPPVTGG